MNYNIDQNGYYGNFGGAFIPEPLQETVENLKKAYLRIKNDASFEARYYDLLKNYVGRPSPLYLAQHLSEKYGASIYLKREDLNHTGAHKINNALGQILLAKEMGKTRIIAETGAGQHGVATATVCALMGLDCTIFMGKTDIERQHLNVQKMQMLGAKVEAVTSGNMTLNDAVNEALAYWCSHPESFYLIGSAVGPHPYPDMVGYFQSVISKEIKTQMQEQVGRDYPDYLIACVGGGSNAMGTYYHYINDERVRLISAEGAGLGILSGKTAATITCGREGVLHGSKTLVIQDEKGEVSEAYSISAGLDYPGVGPAHAHFARTGRSKVFAITDDEALKAAFELTQKEGIIPALESAHALAVLPKMKFRPEDVVVLTVSGRGDKDMETYTKAFERGVYTENR